MQEFLKEVYEDYAPHIGSVILGVVFFVITKNLLVSFLVFLGLYLICVPIAHKLDKIYYNED